MNDEEFVASKLSKIVSERRFAILFEVAVACGLGCPLGEFQPDEPTEECRTPQLAVTDTCLKCWADYTHAQSLLDLGFIEMKEHKDDD